MRVTVLGCGTSGGVPMLGPKGWGACDPHEPRNRRRRVSILVQQGETTLLVDTSPDLREQLLDAGIYRLDGVLYTHGHADHTHGIDDLRSVNYYLEAPLNIYAASATLAELQERFAYTFLPRTQAGYRPNLAGKVIDGPFAIGAIAIEPFDQIHGHDTTLGFRFGPIAYSTDVNDLSAQAFAVLAGVKVWIVDCLGERPHPTHSHLEQTLAWIERVKPERAILTHMNQHLDYRTLSDKLPPGVEPGYDGLVIEL